MVGKKHIDYIKWNLWSICNSWSTLPNLTIYSDDTLTTAQIKDKLSFWTGHLKIYTFELVNNYHKSRNRNALVQYAKFHPLGKKLAVILYHAEDKPTLWVDCDMLFYKDSTQYIPQIEIDSFFCGGSEDWITAYDVRLVNSYFKNLKDFEKFSSGILLINGKNIYEDFELESALDSLNKTYDFFTEQTIIAYLAKDSLGIIWDQNKMMNAMDDRQEIFPEKTWPVARHYTTNVRHLFWRDLFFFYFKLTK